MVRSDSSTERESREFWRSLILRSSVRTDWRDVCFCADNVDCWIVSSCS